MGGWVFLELRVHEYSFGNDSILIMIKFAWCSKLLRHRDSNSAYKTLVHCSFSLTVISNTCVSASMEVTTVIVRTEKRCHDFR